MDEIERVRQQMEESAARWLEALGWEEVDSLWRRQAIGFRQSQSPQTIWSAIQVQLREEDEL